MNQTQMDLNKICSQVIKIVHQTADFITKEANNFDRNLHLQKKELNSLVSYVDKHAEEMLVNALKQIIPQAGFIAEEGTGSPNQEGYNWIIDPLDGTTNFMHNIPIYSISIALMQNGEVVLGVVMEINKRECFYAYKNGGAFLNDKPIRISEEKLLSESLIATGFPYSNFDKINEYMSLLRDMMHHSRGLRRLGSAAVDICYVACGRFNGFFEYNLSPWDVAGGSIILQEAGGIVSDFNGKGNYIFGKQILVSSPSIHPQMLERIQRFFGIEP